MPTMPVMLPRRLLSGLDNPLSARMKQTPAIRYASRTQAGCTMPGSAILPLPLLVHREHALCDRKAAEDVHAGERDCDKAEPLRPGHSAGRRCDQRADYDY